MSLSTPACPLCLKAREIVDHLLYIVGLPLNAVTYSFSRRMSIGFAPEIFLNFLKQQMSNAKWNEEIVGQDSLWNGLVYLAWTEWKIVQGGKHR